MVCYSGADGREEVTGLYSFLRSFLFRLDPETAHQLAILGLKLMQTNAYVKKKFRQQTLLDDPRLQSQYFGLTFPNPVGLAAGFDKNAQVYPALAALGFGFIEVGTLTPRPQAGNPKPRIFRLPEEQAIINRMGFNNGGIAKAKSFLSRYPHPHIPIGINLGKNKDTPNKKAIEDYQQGLSQLYPYGDYFVINVSSPNTEGLRKLQQIDALQQLLSALMEQRERLSAKYNKWRPLLLKIAPDLSVDECTEIVKTALATRIDGLIATNTTVARHGLRSPVKKEAGGLSGKPLRSTSTEMIRQIYRITQGRIPIIGTGGIFTGQDAFEKIQAGANLIQVYTGMIYEGPLIAKKINQQLLQLLDQHGIPSIEKLVGQEHRS